MRSLVLAGLIGLSLVLSHQLWTVNQSRVPLTTDPARVKAGERPSLEALLAPREIILHLGRDRHHVLHRGDARFMAVWRRAGRWLEPLEDPDPVTITSGSLAEEMTARRQGPGLEMILPVALEPQEWLSAWDGQKHGPNRPAVRRIFFSAARPAAVYYWSEGELPTHRSLWPEGEGFADLTADLAGGPPLPEYRELPPKAGGLEISPGVFGPSDPVEAPTIDASAGISGPGAEAELEAEREAARFFLDLSVVRTIKERDGALIFTDGRKGLRVYPGGSLEYTSVPPSALQTVGLAGGDSLGLWDALDQTRDFMAGYGGWPRSAVLEEALPEEGGWRLRFSYRLGKLPAAGPVGPLEVILRGLNIIEFRRGSGLSGADGAAGFSEGPSVQAISPVRAIEAVGENWMALFPGERPRPVRSVRLVYWVPHRPDSAFGIRPAWAVEFDGLAAFVDAAGGQVLR